MHVVAKVTARFGPSWRAVRDQPYDETLESYLALLDLERLEGLEADWRQVRQGVLDNFAVANPKALNRENANLERRLNRGPYGKEAVDVKKFLDWPGMPNYKRTVH